jgi:predicted Fe-Mo cluster-binding NifX family protein
MILSSEEINNFQTIDEKSEQGTKQKAIAIVNFLKEKDVHVLVSEQFCKNINLLNEYFIPVVLMRKQQDEIIDILNKHQHWIKDEWENNSSGFKLFTINSGILKTSLDIKNAEDCTI